MQWGDLALGTGSEGGLWGLYEDLAFYPEANGDLLLSLSRGVVRSELRLGAVVLFCIVLVLGIEPRALNH